MRPVLLAMALLLLPILLAPAASAAQPKWRGEIAGGLEPWEAPDRCDEKDSCEMFGGTGVSGRLPSIVLRDIDVSQIMDGRDDPAPYIVKDLSGYVPLTLWRLCMYDGQDELIRCDQQGSEDYLTGELPTHTDSIRLIQVQNQRALFQIRLAI